jgi:hypothetical protein
MRQARRSAIRIPGPAPAQLLFAQTCILAFRGSPSVRGECHVIDKRQKRTKDGTASRGGRGLAGRAADVLTKTTMPSDQFNPGSQ